jgi:plastocyanin
VVVIRGDADHDYTAMRPPLTAALLALAVLAGCGGDDPAGTGTGAGTPAGTATAATATRTTDTIRIKDFVYSPTPATVMAGQRISVPNADAAPHTITDAGSGKAFDSGTIKGRATGSLTIDRPGTYRYICEFHPFLKGEITVPK